MPTSAYPSPPLGFRISERSSRGLKRETPTANGQEAAGGACSPPGGGVQRDSGSADASDHVARAHALAQTGRERDQDRVAGLVAVRVVDTLEVVEIGEHERACPTVPRGPGKLH